jgi:hypothetical protein
VRSFQVVKVNPGVQVLLKGIQIVVDLCSERHCVELILHGAVKPFTDPIALRMPYLRLAVLYAFQLQVEFILVLFRPLWCLAERCLRNCGAAVWLHCGLTRAQPWVQKLRPFWADVCAPRGGELTIYPP